MTVASGAPRSTRARRIVVLCLALLCAGFIALGGWQIQRLQWKNALVAQVDQRVHAAPAAAPSPASWTSLSKDHAEYRHVRLDGRFLDGLATRVQAVTELGAGYWVLTPLRTGDGAVVFVNRGFIPTGATATGAGDGAASVTGLLRMSERGGAFLRNNDPSHDRWYSRDVEAIGAARGLARVAPYFIDQDAAPKTGTDPVSAVAKKTGTDPVSAAPIKTGTDPVSGVPKKTGSVPVSGDGKTGSVPVSDGGAAVDPVGGLTVISFHNNHLVYALTWFAMALMAAGASFAIGRGKI